MRGANTTNAQSVHGIPLLWTSQELFASVLPWELGLNFSELHSIFKKGIVSRNPAVFLARNSEFNCFSRVYTNKY
jgi:hypothetical protein